MKVASVAGGTVLGSPRPCTTQFGPLLDCSLSFASPLLFVWICTPITTSLPGWNRFMSRFVFFCAVDANSKHLLLFAEHGEVCKTWSTCLVLCFALCHSHWFDVNGEPHFESDGCVSACDVGPACGRHYMRIAPRVWFQWRRLGMCFELCSDICGTISKAPPCVFIG